MLVIPSLPTQPSILSYLRRKPIVFPSRTRCHFGRCSGRETLFPESGPTLAQVAIWETEPTPPPTPRSRPFGLLAPASHKRWVAVKLRSSLRFLSVLCVSALKRIPQTVTESRAR